MLKISEFAERTKRSTRALRLYEERGLLSPSKRSEGGFRLYEAEQELRLHYIDKLKSLGCSLSEIQSLIGTWRESPTAAEGMRSLKRAYQQKLDEVQHAIELLQQVERELQESLTFLEGCQGCSAEGGAEGACGRCDRTEEQTLTLINGLVQPQPDPDEPLTSPPDTNSNP